jgi:hypothetical protein
MTAYLFRAFGKSETSLVRTATLFTFFLLVGAGCGSSSGPAGSTEGGHIKKVAALIPEFAAAHEGIPPANIEELKSWCVENGKAEDKDFLSTRDKEPYVVVVYDGGKPKKGTTPFVHEATGKNGMKFMVNGGAVTEISEQGLGYMTGGTKALPKGPGGRNK